MQNDLLSTADALPDRVLLDRLPVLAANERAASVELVAHLAALDARPNLYAARAYTSLFAYCTEALRLSEDAAYTRVTAARACRRFPQILGLLSSGTLTLTSVRLIGPHLTGENHEDVIARASNRTVAEVKTLAAELAPQPDARSLVRRLPAPAVGKKAAASEPALRLEPTSSTAPVAARATELAIAPPRPAPPPVVRPTALERYRVQFTMDQETKDQFDRVQALLRREVPSGDPGLIFKRAIALLLDRVERKKLGKADRPRPVTRFETERDAPEGLLPPRDPASGVRRTVWARDEGRCGYVSADGRRCSARAYIEFHHQQPYGMRGEPTVENMALRCWRHNQFEAQVMFGEWTSEPRTAPAGGARPPAPSAGGA